MYYIFNSKNGIVHAWIDVDHIQCGYGRADVMCVDGKAIDEVQCQMYANDNGDAAFKFRGEEFVMGDAIIHTMSEIKQMFEKGENVFSEMLMQAIMADGLENVRFGIKLPAADAFIGPFAVCSNKTAFVKSKIVPGFNRMPHGNYKLKFEAVEEHPDLVLCREEFYTSDMVSLIKRGHITIMDSIDDGKTSRRHFREYLNSVTKSENNNGVEVKLN